MKITPKLKALMDWLNNNAFIGWSLVNHRDLEIEYLIEISEKQTDEYQKLLDEFMKEKILMIEKVKEEQ